MSLNNKAQFSLRLHCKKRFCSEFNMNFDFTAAPAERMNLLPSCFRFWWRKGAEDTSELVSNTVIICLYFTHSPNDMTHKQILIREFSQTEIDFWYMFWIHLRAVHATFLFYWADSVGGIAYRFLDDEQTHLNNYLHGQLSRVQIRISNTALCSSHIRFCFAGPPEACEISYNLTFRVTGLTNLGKQHISFGKYWRVSIQYFIVSTKKDAQRHCANPVLVNSAFILIHTRDYIHKY